MSARAGCSAWSALSVLQRAPELGHGRAAIAQQGLERARAVAVADQGEPEPTVGAAALLEQLGFDAIRARQTPRGDRDAPREHGLQRADRRQLRDQRRLEPGELGAVLVRQHEMLLRAHAVLQGILRRPRPAFGRSSARATSRHSCGSPRRAHCDRGTAARAAPALDMAGFLLELGLVAGGVRLLEGNEHAAGQPGSGESNRSRNFVHSAPHRRCQAHYTPSPSPGPLSTEKPTCLKLGHHAR